MSSIKQFAISGMWDYRNTIIPIATAIPLIVEGAIFAHRIYKEPQIIQEKFRSFKDLTIRSFTIQKPQNKKEELQRILKNCFYLLSCLACMGAASYFAIHLLPGTLGITTALSAIFFLGKLFLNAKTYQKKVVDAFKAQEKEDPEAAKKRIRNNALKAALVVAVAAAAIGIGLFILTPMIKNGFSWSVSLPWQTKGVVFAEYAAVGFIHGAQAYRKWKKGDKAGALYHLFAGALCFIFPGYYWNHQMRLHHSFYGLLLMATPFRSLQIFGGFVTFDSALYMIAPWRGYTTISPFGGGVEQHEYDFINSVVDHYKLFAATYAGGVAAQNINDSLKKPQ